MGPPVKQQKGITFGFCDETTGQRVYPAPPPMSDLLPDQVPPAQAVVKLPHSEGEMFASITCWPPLGQATTIARDDDVVQFSIVLETNDTTLTDDGVDVCVWHNQNSETEWSELSLRATNDMNDLMHVNTTIGTKQRWFQGQLKGRPSASRSISFTIKFRSAKDSGWKWINEQHSIDDGILHYLPSREDHDLSHFFKGISSEFTITKEQSETPDTTLFSLTAPVSPAHGDTSGYSSHSLGKPVDSQRWFSLVRLWSPWLAPRQGRGKFSPDKDAVLSSFLRSDGLHVVCLALSGIDDVLTIFKHDGNGNVTVQGRNDKEAEGTNWVLVAIAEEFEVANAAVMYHARKIVADNPTTAREIKDEEMTLMDKNVKAEYIEEWYDGLTYCTWNALGQNLTEQKIFDALDILQKENIVISNLIIDDNWQSLSDGKTQFDRAWMEFDANKEGFPRGLKAAVTDIRNKHPNIRHIAVWHAILGYWGGVAPHGKIAKDYKTIQVQKEKGVAEGLFTVVAAEDANRMYDDFYRFLSSAGIDSVKTDAQFFLDLLSQAPARKALTTTYQDAWTIAHLRHFSSRAISCMSQTPPILFHSQVPTNKPTLLVRNSDDFFPEVPASHPWHIFCNAHNSILTQHLNVLPDWDMFQTNHEWASFHAAGRCVSGGPIYFTDYPGKHDIKLIKQMTAKTTQGKNIILRPHRVGRSINAYAGYEDQVLLKVGTYVGFARTGTGILGVFNCVSRPLAEFVRLDEFPGVEKGIRYVVRDFEGQVSQPVSKGEAKSMVRVNLDVRGWAILAAHPLREFEMKDKSAIEVTGKSHGEAKTVGVGMLGLVGKMTGSAAVVSHDIYIEENGRLRMWTSLKAVGVLGVYISGLADKNVDRDVMVLLRGKPIIRDSVRISSSCSQVLEIDIEKAWEESKEEPGWTNEVSIEVFLS